MKIDTLPDAIPAQPGALWIDPATGRLMIADGERYIALAALRPADAGRLADLVAELAWPALPPTGGTKKERPPGG